MTSSETALATTTHPRAETIQKLLAWCRKTSPNFMIKEQLVGFKTLPDGTVTAVALKDIPADTRLIRVTPELMFSARDLKRKWRSVFNEIESKVRRYTETCTAGFLAGTEAEEPATTMALSFALLLELGDPESKWKPYWDSFPKEVPCIFDFDGDYSHLDGSPWKEQLEAKQAAMLHILKEIVPPVLAKIKGKMGVDDVEGTLKRAYGLWQSRQLKDDVHNKRAQYLVPVLDLIDGESDKLSNVIVDDGPGSTAMHIELVLKSSRKIEAGEELRQMYDSCSNASYLHWYGYITESMVFGNLSHKTYITTTQLCATALEAVEKEAEEGAKLTGKDKEEEEKGVEEMCAIKKALLMRIAGDGSAGLRRSLELTHRSEVFEEAAFVLETIAKIAVCPSLETVKKLLHSLTTTDIKELLKNADELLTGMEGEALAPVALGAVEKILAQLRHGDSYLHDMVALDKAGLKESDRLLIKVRMSEKFLLLRARAEVCKRLGVKDRHERPRVCDNCATFRGLRACGHCGTTAYCSRRCQVLKWREHKKSVAAAGAVSKAA